VVSNEPRSSGVVRKRTRRIRGSDQFRAFVFTLRAGGGGPGPGGPNGICSFSDGVNVYHLSAVGLLLAFRVYSLHPLDKILDAY